MADGGRMYTNFDLAFAREMSVLCRKADIIVPNITEAAFLLGEEYVEPPYSREYIENVVKRLLDFGPKMVVLTGVAFDSDNIGCGVCLESGETYYAFSRHYPGTYYGTGDIFASALTGAYLRGKDIFESARLALEFTCGAIKRTYEAQTDTRLGVNFEQGLGEYIKNLGGV